LKVQIQITRAEQVSEALSATLYHQIICRLQDHAIDLALPSCKDGALFVLANNQEDTPSIVQIPRNISQQELQKLVSMQWVTNYEKLHMNQKPMKLTEATFRKSTDGTVKTIFKAPEDTPSSSSSIFQSLMISPVTKERKIPLAGVFLDGRPLFTDKVNRHFIWDVNPDLCDSDCDCWKHLGDSSDDEDEDDEESDPENSCKPPPSQHKRFGPDNGPWIGIRNHQEPDPDWKFLRCLEILHQEESKTFEGFNIFRPSPVSHASPIPCMMFNTASSEDFPPLERKTDPVSRISSKPHVVSQEVCSDGKMKPLSQAEEVLNWQTENARAQNSILQRLDQKMDTISIHLEKSDEKLQLLSSKMRKYYKQLSSKISRVEEEWKSMTFGEASHAKEREIRRLKAQIKELDDYISAKERQQADSFPSLFNVTQSYTFQNPSSYFQQKPTWSLPTASPHRARQNPESSKPKKEKNQTFHLSSEESAKETQSSPLKRPIVQEQFQDSQDPYSQFAIEPVITSSSATEEIRDISSDNSESSEELGFVDVIYDSPDDEIDSASSKAKNLKVNGRPWFTLDDIPPNKWRARLIEFGAWLDTKMMREPDTYKVIEEFCCRMTRTLKEWYHNLGTVRQNQFHELGRASAVLGALHEEFIDDGSIIDKKLRQEFFEMKCCSVKIDDLEKHYQRMSKRFYLLNGLNDPSLKNTYVASLPVEIQPELNRMAIAIQKDFTSLTLGQIHQMTLEAVDKLCRQHKFFADIMNQKSKFDKACKKSYLEIKCKKSCSGNCSRNCSKKKKGRENLEERKKRKSFKSFKKKKIRGRRNDQRCFICNKKGHFSRNCPQQKDKAIRLISTLNLCDSEEVESIYSEQSSTGEETMFALAVSSEESSDSETEKFPVFST